MIVSDLELHFARGQFASLQSQDNSPTPPGAAPLQLLIRMPSSDSLPPTAILNAHLHIQQHITTDVSTQAMTLPWLEENRVAIPTRPDGALVPFDYRFLSDRRYDIRIEFFVVENKEGDRRDVCVGYVMTCLEDVLQAEHERLELQFHSQTNHLQNSRVELALGWIKFWDHKMILKFHISVDKRSGWPFSMARPFFVLYRWEPAYSSWTPMYRSEVMASDTIFGGRAFVYETVELLVRDALGNDDLRPMRLEFFHYKTKSDPKLLGYFGTTLQALRQVRGGELKMDVNTFPEGELVGKLKMTSSRVTALGCTFNIEANFGGDVEGDLVYFDVSLTSRETFTRSTRPLFSISKYSDRAVWEPVYRSTKARASRGSDVYRWDMAKVTERTLNGGRNRRTLSVEFHQMIKGELHKLGRIETTVATLLEAKLGTSFALDGGDGVVTLVAAEETDPKVYFGLHCLLGAAQSDP